MRELTFDEVQQDFETVSYYDGVQEFICTVDDNICYFLNQGECYFGYIITLEEYYDIFLGPMFEFMDKIRNTREGTHEYTCKW